MKLSTDVLRQQNGGVLLLVILAMLVLSVLTLPLLASSTQGEVLSARTQNGERANYAAESGIFVMKRLIKEYAKSNGSVYEADVNAIADQVNGLAFFNEDPIELDFVRESDGIHYVVSEAEILNAKRTIELAVKSFGSLSTGGPTDPSEAPGDGSEFYYNFDLVVDSANEYRAFYTCGNPAVTLERTTVPVINKEVFEEQYNQYFTYATNSLGSSVPSPTTRTTTIEAPSNGVQNYNGNIEFNTKTVTIYGDVVARGNITFKNQVSKIEIQGNLKAGGQIIFERPIDELRVTGDMVSGKGITFNNINTMVTVNGNMYSKGNIQFKVVDGLNVDKSLISEASITFENINSKNSVIIKKDILAQNLSFNSPVNIPIKVGGYMAIRENVTFSNINGSFQLGGFYAGGDTVFNGPINSPPICIDHTAPPVGGSEGGLEFGGWSGQ